MTHSTKLKHGVSRIPKDYVECPCCRSWSIAVINGKIVRHEQGLEYQPYKLYHEIAKRRPERNEAEFVREQAKSQLCPASGKTVEESKRLLLPHPKGRGIRKD